MDAQYLALIASKNKIYMIIITKPHLLMNARPSRARIYEPICLEII